MSAMPELKMPGQAQAGGLFRAGIKERKTQQNVGIKIGQLTGTWDN
jgi:hypothetical protein